MRYFIIILILITNQAFSQHDTTYTYYNKLWRKTAKDSAIYISKVVKENNGWHRLDYWIATGLLQMDGQYSDAETKKREGAFMFYNEDGTMIDSSICINDKSKCLYAFYSNHNKKAYILFDTAGKALVQTGYSIDGKEIPDYIYRQPAVFPGGNDMWTVYLQKHLLKGAPKGYKRGQMSGTVIVRFLIDKEGNVAETEIAESSGYGEIDNHARNVIAKSPRWIPAIEDNVRAPYWQMQQISLVCIP